MTSTTLPPNNYDLIIHRQNKRITKLRADLARYSTKLRQLKTRNSQSHHAALAAAAAAAAAAQQNATDFARIHAAQMQAMYMRAIPSFPMSPHLHPTHSVQPGTKPKSMSNTKQSNQEDDKAGKTRYWTEMEHNQFLYAVKLFGPKNYNAISQFVATRTPKQVRTHAQKYQMRLDREAKKRRAALEAAKEKERQRLALIQEERSVSTCPEEMDDAALLREDACSPISEEGVMIEDSQIPGMTKNSSLPNLADYDDFMRRISVPMTQSRTNPDDMFDNDSNELDMNILNGADKTDQFDDSLLDDL